MKQGVAFLVFWLVVAVILSGTFLPVTSPRHVDWPYYLFVASIPLGAGLYARHTGRMSIVICYGLIAGVWFALPIIDDGRGVMARTTVEPVAIKFGISAFVMALVCSGAFTIGRRLLRKT